jgi:hypothetical protein
MDVKKIRHYSLRIELGPFAGMTGNPYTDVAGLLLEEKPNDRPFGFFQNASLRKELIEKPSKSKHLVSVFKYCAAKRIVSFMLSENDFERMAKKDWHVTLIRTDSWATLSSPAKLSRAKLAEKQLFV